MNRINIGLTGATGAIGHEYLKALLRNHNVEIHALVRKELGMENSKLHLIVGHLFDQKALIELVEQSGGPQRSAPQSEER